ASSGRWLGTNGLADKRPAPYRQDSTRYSHDVAGRPSRVGWLPKPVALGFCEDLWLDARVFARKHVFPATVPPPEPREGALGGSEPTRHRAVAQPAPRA